jgi:UDP-glucose 4-epimerase
MIPYDQAYEQGFEDMHRRIPDTTKIRETIGFQPQRTLDEVLERIIAHWEGRDQAGRSLPRPLGERLGSLAKRVGMG